MTPKFSTYTLLIAILGIGCGSGSGTGGAGGKGGAGGAVGTTLGMVVHVVPGTEAAATTDGSEARPFTSLALAVEAIRATNAWDGTIVLHEGRHELTLEAPDVDFILPATADLQILAGATLALGSNISLHAFRDVKVMGTEAQPVLFTWLTSGMHWGSFTIRGKTSQSNVIQYAVFEHSGESQYQGAGVRGALSILDATAHVSHSVFRLAEGDDGMNMKRSASIVESSLFEDNCCDAFDSDGVTATPAEVFNNVFRNNGNDAVDLGEGAFVHVHDNLMLNNGDKGVSNGEGSAAIVDHNLIIGCSVGIGVKDDADPVITNNTLYGNFTGFRGYHHVDTYGPGKGKFSNGIIWNSMANDVEINDGATTTVTYSCVQKGAVGVGNTSQGAGCDDPMFADVVAGDFHLQSAAGRWDPTTMTFVVDPVTSPCIDGGDPATDIGNETAPNGSRVDLGRYGGTSEASHSR